MSEDARVATSEEVETARPEAIPDLRPFSLEPVILARLNRRDVKVSTVAIVTFLLALVAAAWSSLAQDRFAYPVSQPGTGLLSDLFAFATRRPSAGFGATMPLLRDYPSVILIFTISASVPLIYALFRTASSLHSSLYETDCIRAKSPRHRAHLASAVDKLNRALEQHGRFSTLALAVIAILVGTTNIRLQPDLYPYLASNDLYLSWWAQLYPVTAGGLVWVILGALGIYMVYVEAVIGLKYVAFLRSCRDDYSFGANPLNPDDFFGWYRLRQVTTNLEVGVVVSAVTSLAAFFILQAAFGIWLAVFVVGSFMGIVTYVFFGTMANVRRQVRVDRHRQIREIAGKIPHESAMGLKQDIARLVAYERLSAIRRIPDLPIRKSALFAGVVTLLASAFGMIMQLLRYLNGP